jgi:phosphoglycolate phosphatase
MTGGAVLFDLDGTLVDTPRGIVMVFADVLAEVDVRLPEQRLRDMIGRPLATCFARFLELPEDHADVARAIARFRELFTKTVVPNAGELVFPGVPAMLTALRAIDRPLAIVTSKVKASADELLGAAKLDTYFEVVVGHDMADRGKPHPDLAELAATRLGRPAGQCVVVGDAVDDIRMAVAAGMPSYGVSYGVAGRDELLTEGAIAVLDSIAELETVLTTQPLPAFDR